MATDQSTTDSEPENYYQTFEPSFSAAAIPLLPNGRPIAFREDEPPSKDNWRNGPDGFID